MCDILEKDIFDDNKLFWRFKGDGKHKTRSLFILLKAFLEKIKFKPQKLSKTQIHSH